MTLSSLTPARNAIVIDVSTGRAVLHQVNEITDPSVPIPYAPERYSLGCCSPSERFDIHFMAEDVPALGWKVYRLVPSSKQSRKSDLLIEKNSIENRFYRLELDPATGAISSIYDKEFQRELVDRSEGHGINRIIVRSSVTGAESSSGSVSIEQGLKGPVSASLIVKTDAPGCPQIIQEIVLYSDIKRIDISNRVLKDSTPLQEIFFAFPFAFDRPKIRYEGPLCVVEPIVDQFPGSNTNYYTVQHWADVSDQGCGVTLCSLDVPVMQFGGNWPLRVSANHRVCPPQHNPALDDIQAFDNGHIYSLIMTNNFKTNFTVSQSGDMLFRYSITSHQGDWKEGKARDFAYRASLPLIHALVQGPQEGQLAPSSGFCRIEPDNVMLLTLKQAEDEEGYIIRVMETEGRDTDITISLPSIEIDRAVETNLVEEDQNPLQTTHHSVRAYVRKWSTATMRLIAKS